MEESKKNNNFDIGGDKEILYSKTIKAGKRIYYIDVKKVQKMICLSLLQKANVFRGKATQIFLSRSIKYSFTRRISTGL